MAFGYPVTSHQDALTPPRPESMWLTLAQPIDVTTLGFLPSVCVFPSCPELGVPVDLTGQRFCEACGRPLSGPSFGRRGAYRIRAFLGSGYYADVFRVTDLESQASHAAKMYFSEPAKRQAASWELVALQALSHPRLPALKESFEDSAWLFVVMGIVEGPNLRDDVESHGPLTVDHAVELGIDVCEVLDYVASQSWTYRDLHPKNVHRTASRGAMLLDLDNARPSRLSRARARGQRRGDPRMRHLQPGGLPVFLPDERRPAAGARSAPGRARVAFPRAPRGRLPRRLPARRSQQATRCVRSPVGARCRHGVTCRSGTARCQCHARAPAQWTRTCVGITSRCPAAAR